MDEDGFRRVFDDHYGLVVAYARRRGASHADAQDVAAEVFAIAWRRRADVPPDAVRPWLLGVARRVLANQRRGAGRRARLLDRAVRLAPPPAADDPLAGVDPALARALASLPAQDAEVLRLVAWEELTHAEIGQLLGLTPSAVASRVARARERLTRALRARNDLTLGGV